MSNYGYKTKIDDPFLYGYDRKEVPDYLTADITHVFLDVDYFIMDDHVIVEKRMDINKDIKNIDDWCGKDNIKREWIFTGGGFHGHISASGPAKKLDDAVRFIASETGARIDLGSENLATCMRVINSKNRKYGNHIIPVSIDEITSTDRDGLLELAKEKRTARFSLGEDEWVFADVKAKPKENKVSLGQYNRVINVKEKNEVLAEYGLDWDVDFCPAMQYLITSKAPCNEDRRFIIKYLKDVLYIPFVDVLDDKKTVGNLLYNIMENKNKARHAIKERQCEMIYKRNRRFHPYRLRLEGLCPEDCAECLEKRK
jgi:hypothetical protein